MKCGDTKHSHAHKDVVVVVGEVIEDNIVKVQVKASILIDYQEPQSISFMDRLVWT